MPAELVEILIESTFAYIFFIAFATPGSFFLNKTGVFFPGINNKYGYAFYSLLFGLLVAVGIYSIIISGGITINVFIIPLLFFLVKGSKRKVLQGRTALPYFEILLIVITTVIILHIFPESEYKQNDSFYYLKISESLNQTGEENTHHYNNLYSSVYHGTEPYHYFDLWCNSLITAITSPLYSAIKVFRFVVQAIFISAIILGLYNLLLLLIRSRICYWHKLFCWAMVFFMPDILAYVPSLSAIFISNFEGGFLERPNFRILYALLIPLVAENISTVPRIKIVCFWLVLLGIVSFKFAVIIIPSVFLLAAYRVFVQKDQNAKQFLWYTGTFACCLVVFYLITGNKHLPSIYSTSLPAFIKETTTHWKFILFSIFSSAVYIFIIAVIFLSPGYFIKKNRKWLLLLLKKNSLLLLIALVGLSIARIFFLKDNAYQFLFAAHIIALLLVWTIAGGLMQKASGITWILAALLFASPMVIKVIASGKPVNIFKQNGDFVYNGKEYSAVYIDSVSSYFKRNPAAKGAYLADSSFYSATYYSKRNPNVYFLPITYIISAKVNNNNIDFCISDSTSIMKGVTGTVHKDYLGNAIQRSIFYQYHKKYPGMTLLQTQYKFMKDHGLSYLVATGNVPIDFFVPAGSVIFTDTATSERFIILKP